MATSAIASTDRNGMLIRSLVVIAIAGHAIILGACAAAAVWPLVYANIGSIGLYLAAILLNRRQRYRSVLVVGLLEVLAHAVFATWVLGWSAGFHIYILALVPLVFFLDTVDLRGRALIALGVSLVYVTLAWYAHEFLPVDERGFVDLFRYGNLLTVAAVLCALSYYYGRTFAAAQTELEAVNMELTELARTDALTGLPNRREGLYLLNAEEVRSYRSTDSFAVALADVDNFKRVNDEFGHDTGDAVLVEVGRRLTEALRAQDTIVRWGGEEFLLLLPQTNREGSAIAAEKARAAICANPIHAGDSDVTVSITIGVAVYELGRQISDLIRDADVALYRGKESGRNRVQHSW
jgi:diguanylate cyclase (GGDEF)-like protein